MFFRQLYDLQTSTYTYLLADEVSREAVLIDPVYEQAMRDEAFVSWQANAKKWKGHVQLLSESLAHELPRGVSVQRCLVSCTIER